MADLKSNHFRLFLIKSTNNILSLILQLYKFKPNIYIDIYYHYCNSNIVKDINHIIQYLKLNKKWNEAKLAINK